PLRDGDQNGRNPAKNDPEVWNHCENGNKTTDEDGKISSGRRKKREGCANQNAIDEADEELSTKIGDDVAVDLQENVGDLVFERRIMKREVIFPTSLDSGPLLKKEK